MLIAAAGCRRAPDEYRPVIRPPATRTAPVTETLHGVAITDEYRWLEGGSNPDGSNPGQMTAEVAAWTDAQNSYTRAVLDGAPGRAAVETSLSSLLDVGDVSLPLVGGNRYFFWQRAPGDQLPIIFMREGALGADRALVRPEDLDSRGMTAAQWIMPSPDGKWLAMGIAQAGAAESTLRLLEVDSGRPVPLEIRGSPRAVYWLPDSTGFVYQRVVDAAAIGVFFHRMGQDPSRDRLALRVPGGPAMAAGQLPFASLSDDGRWLIVGNWTAPGSNELSLVSFDQARGQAGAVRRVVTKGTAGQTTGVVAGTTLFIRTTKDAPNGRIVAADVVHPDEAHWRTIVPERADAIEDVAFARGLIAVTYLKQASSVTEVFDNSGRSLGVLAQPGFGATALSTGEDRTDAFLLFESFNRAPTIFRVDLQSPSTPASQWKASVAPVDPDSISVELVRYPAKDGTEISMFVARRKDLALNGALPTILSGYGAFGVSMRPVFAAHWFQWFQAGGVLAIPHVRGGGEYGERWHAAGVRDRKQTSVDDFTAAAEWLVAHKYTNPDKLAVVGGAAGGLLGGTAMVSRPDLFRAVVLVSPLLDMLRYDRFLQAAAWTPEFGSASDPAALAWLRSLSPYEHVTPGTRYPGVLLVASDADTPVHAMHVRKMAARLQAASSGDPAERPILLWIEKPDDSTAPASRALKALVDQRAFLMWQLGMR